MNGLPTNGGSEARWLSLTTVSTWRMLLRKRLRP
jgi:hypothetical protein